MKINIDGSVCYTGIASTSASELDQFNPEITFQIFHQELPCQQQSRIGSS